MKSLWRGMTLLCFLQSCGGSTEKDVPPLYSPVQQSTGGKTSVSTISDGGSNTIGGATLITVCGGTIDSSCSSTIHETISWQTTDDLKAGATNVEAFHIELEAAPNDIPVSSISFDVIAKETNPHDASWYASSTGTNFINFRLLDLATGNIVQGPVNPDPYSTANPNRATFPNGFDLIANQPKLFAVILDISDSFSSPQAVTHYSIYYGSIGARVPQRITYADGFDALSWPIFTVTIP